MKLDDNLNLDSVALEDIKYFRTKLLNDQTSIKALRQYELARDAFIINTLAKLTTSFEPTQPT